MSTPTTDKTYPEVDPSPSFPKMEEATLASWKKDGTFERSIENRPAGEKGANEFTFYDGPPFANGLPHFGHILTGYVKDVIPRYQTMKGQRVERRFGWDCHGLPAEMATEKEIGVSGRTQIVEYGIEKFNKHCGDSVQRYTKEWEQFVTRQSRWVDFDDDYKTMDTPYMESVMWAFKELWDKGYIYEGFRVMPYSWAMQTPLSNFETRLDNAYRERQDPALTVRFELIPADGADDDNGPMDVLAWTTTPWTLPSNLALAVGKDIEYTIYEQDGRRFVIGTAAHAKYASELEGATAVGTLQGSELVGRKYKPLFPYFAKHENAFQILSADFVNTDDGTGVVHMAPGFGEDDMETCKEYDIEVVCPVDDGGCFTLKVSDYEGQQVLEANKPIIKDLKAQGVVFKHETYLHNYPHCWRTDTPLIYKAMTSWYVKVSAFRDRMVELNQEINWVPDHIKDGLFGNWLEGARDWSISRNRFWGAPIPIWRSDDPKYPRLDVYGSIDELERDFGVRLEDLHRPGIDELTRPNPDDPTGKSTMRRVTDVLDCWFESGSMPYAQVHYPFENQEWFDQHAPADFIVEYIAQTRGWFYTLMVLSTALFDRPPFKNVICHGVVLAEDGQKLSKRLKNYPDPNVMFDKYGADALRWYMISSPILRGLDLKVDLEGKAVAEPVRLVLNPIWNAYYFFTLYANSDGIRAEFKTDPTDVLDRYVLAKTRTLVKEIGESLDAYDLPGACQVVRGFLDALNNWYIRRSRSRFWRTEKDADKTAAYDTLYTALHCLCRATAPLLPLLTEEVYRGLTGEDSVHLTDWPDIAELPEDDALIAAMDRVRDVCSTTLGLREDAKLPVRQPLAKLIVAGESTSALEPFKALIASEVNVREVVFAETIDEFADRELKVNARAVGPRLGGRMKEIMQASKKGEWKALDDGRVEVLGEILETSEFAHSLKAHKGVTCSPLGSNDAICVLDTELTPELLCEGRARNLVRCVQIARKEQGLHVSDRIVLGFGGLSPEFAEAVRTHEKYIGEQTLATEVRVLEGEVESSEAEIGGMKFRISIQR